MTKLSNRADVTEDMLSTLVPFMFNTYCPKYTEGRYQSCDGTYFVIRSWQRGTLLPPTLGANSI